MEQQDLGWKQIYYGQITKSWSHSINISNNAIKGAVFYSRVLLLIWRAIIEQWQLCNQHLHPANAQAEDQTLLEHQVYQIIQEVQEDPNLQDIVQSVDPIVLLGRPIKQIRQWISNSRNHMQAQQKAAILQAQLHTRDIWTYFNRPQATEPKTNGKNLL